MFNRHLSFWLFLVALNGTVRGQEQLLSIPMTPPSSWVDARGIHGNLIIVGGGDLPQDIVDLFCEKAGGRNAKLVVIPTAKEAADDPVFVRTLRMAWNLRNIPNTHVMHTRLREQANDPDFVKPLMEATAVWIDGGIQERLSLTYADTLVERAIKNVLRRGGVIGGTSAGAAIQSRTMIVEGRQKARIGRGFDLLPGSIVDQHFTERRRIDRLADAIDQNPHLFGVGIDESTALVVEDRSMRVVGKSNVTIYHAPTPLQERNHVVLSAKDAPVDLPVLRREARQRTVASHGSSAPLVPKVDRGSVMLVGGGLLNTDLASQFVKLAGGPEAPIVILPTSAEYSETEATEFLSSVGASNIIVLPQSEWKDDQDQEMLTKLRSAKGIWFDGERPWHFCEVYEDSPILGILRDVLEEGGVIGGTSAGASILGEYLVGANNPEPNVLASTGIKPGFGLIPGATLDDKLLNHDTLPGLEAISKFLPQCWTIGLDESTALIVRGSKGRITGKKEVRLFRPKQDELQDPIVLTDGDVFDFERHEKIDIAEFDWTDVAR